MSSDTHRSIGVAEETKVICEFDGGAYGPAGDRMPVRCPYCGGNARGGKHTIILDGDEVICEDTSQSTYRFCPGCGERLGASNAESSEGSE